MGNSDVDASLGRRMSDGFPAEVTLGQGLKEQGSYSGGPRVEGFWRSRQGTQHVQTQEGVGECCHQSYHGVCLAHRVPGEEEQDDRAGAGSPKVRSASAGWGREGSDGFTQEGHQSGVWKGKLGVLHALVGKPYQEQESCSALQLPSWLPLGHPPNPPGPCP